ncbi:hypothetical protein PYCC9005_005614 [Savitreella phatthalungensis]
MAPSPSPTASAWQSPPSIYADHISSTTLPPACDVCIIGAGFTGVSLAWHLLNSSVDPPTITLIEARGLCSGASGRNGGHLSADPYSYTLSLLDAGFSREDVVAHAQFELDNFDALTALIKQEQIDCEYVAKPHLDVALTDADANVLKRALEHMRNLGGPVDACRIYERASATTRARTHCRAAIEHPHSASLNPYKLVTGLLTKLIARYPTKLRLYTYTPVTKTLRDGTVLTSNRDRTRAKAIILATNAYTSQLVPSLAKHIVPVRAQIHYIAGSPRTSPDNCSYNAGGEYLSQRPCGSVVLGGGRRFASAGHGEVGVSDDSAIDPHVRSFLTSFAHRTGLTLGGRDEQTRAQDWTGIMGFTHLGIPLVHRLSWATHPHDTPLHTDIPRFICAGFSGHGMPRIWLSARHIATQTLRSLNMQVSLPLHTTTLPRGYSTPTELDLASLDPRNPW